MNRRCALSATFFLGAFVPLAFGQTSPTNYVTKLGQEFEVRSGSRVVADEVLAAGGVILPDLAAAGGGGPSAPQIQLRGGNLQVSNPALDYVQTFPGFRSFVHATQSEVSSAAFGRNIVVTYNNSAGAHLVTVPGGVAYDHIFFSGYSTSNDGGQTWTSGFMPPVPGSVATYGDPSIDVDRRGVFYFAGLGQDAAGGFTIQVNKSTDGGNTWSPAVVVQQDEGADKEWLAVGPDPVNKSRDNVYVTWTSFQNAACELRLAKSIDGGATWAVKTIFVPTANANPAFPTNCLQYSNPTVDPVTGILYVPFLRFSNADQDFIQMMISNDAGATFHFATFNVPGAPSPTLLPVTQPGELIECGATLVAPRTFSVNLRLSIHAGLPTGPTLTGLRRFTNASRLTAQPSVAVRNGVVYMAWNNSTSLTFGAQGGGSNILFMKSTDGGSTWSGPVLVNPVVTDDQHHVLPSLAIDQDPNDVHITYYTQHSNGTVDLDMANSHDGGASFPMSRLVHVTSTSFNLPPTNVPLPTTSNPFGTTNYDRTIQQCYALGEYQNVITANGNVYASWGDMRNLLTQPVNSLDPISGQVHPQEDVFFQKVKAQ